MPKFKNEEARQSFRARLAEVAEHRIDLVTDIVIDVLRANGNQYTRRKIGKAVPEQFERDPERYLRGDKRMEKRSLAFINSGYVDSKWPDIKANAADRGWPIVTDFDDDGRPCGIIITRDPDKIKASISLTKRILDGIVDANNEAAEAIQRRLPGIQPPLPAFEVGQRLLTVDSR